MASLSALDRGNSACSQHIFGSLQPNQKNRPWTTQWLRGLERSAGTPVEYADVQIGGTWLVSSDPTLHNNTSAQETAIFGFQWGQTCSVTLVCKRMDLIGTTPATERAEVSENSLCFGQMRKSGPDMDLCMMVNLPPSHDPLVWSGRLWNASFGLSLLHMWCLCLL